MLVLQKKLMEIFFLQIMQKMLVMHTKQTGVNTKNKGKIWQLKKFQN